jgi:DNA-binding response OmpR family regulator
MQQATELVGSGASLCPTILVIEDNRDLQVLLKAQLTSFGTNPVGKYTGRGGLEWLRENKADLVILDWMLPDTDGLSVTKAIRKTHSPSALPILMLSALGHSADRRVIGLEAGANDFMAKPYEVEEQARIYSQLKVKEEVARERLMSAADSPSRTASTRPRKRQPERAATGRSIRRSARLHRDGGTDSA